MAGWEYKGKEAELVEYESILQEFPGVLGEETSVKQDVLLFWGKKWEGPVLNGLSIGHLPSKARAFAISATLSQKK